MDARTKKHGHVDEEVADEARMLAETITAKRDRLLASLTLIAGIGMAAGLPFALREGAEFFMPITAALVVAVALVPATDWVAQVPSKIAKVRSALEPIFDLYKNLDRFIGRTVSQIEIASAQSHTRAVRIETPNSMLGLLTTSAPHLLIQLFFSLLVIFFFLAGWTAMRKRTIVSRGSFEGALTTARVIQQVVDATSTYLGTITVINIGLGALTAGALWMLGMPSPVMWSGIVAVANYIATG